MSERETQEFAGSMNPREKLEAAVRNPFYQKLSCKSEPLTRSRLAQAWRDNGVSSYVNPGLGILENVIGWPTDADQFEHLRREYYTGRRFLDYWGRPRSEGDRNALGAFPMHLRTIPPTALELVSGNPPSVHGHPLWKIRLNTLMPDLLEGVASELGDIDDEWVMLDYMLGDPKLQRALQMSYQVGGRLVRPDDDRRHAGLKGGFFLKDIPIITDVHQALTAESPLVK